MSWFNIHKRSKETNEDTTPDTTTQPTSSASSRILPPHMQRLIEERSKSLPRQEVSPEEQRAVFARKRMAIDFDIAQGELASSGDNPWTHRIELLTEALETVQDDQEALKHVEREPYAPLPSTPITDITITENDAITVAFTIDGHRFTYEEVLDWAERGHQIALPEFRVVENPVPGIIPESIPENLHEPLTRHLTDSIGVFATDLRDRTLDNEPLPENPTLADLAGSCSACGGWTDWRGRCDACTRRKGEQQALRMEQKRLLQERGNEAEERHRLAERLPLARRRLADLEAEIAAFERKHSS